MDKIIQIMPCQSEWRAVYSEKGKPLLVSLIGWAIMEDDEGSRSVQGLCAGDYVDSPETCTNFLGYASPGDNPSRWEEEAADYQKSEDKTSKR